MDIDEAIKLLVDNEKFTTEEDEAVAILIQEYSDLIKEVSNLARESVKREKELARLEAEVEYLQRYLLSEGFIV